MQRYDSSNQQRMIPLFQCHIETVKDGLLLVCTCICVVSGLSTHNGKFISIGAGIRSWWSCVAYSPTAKTTAFTYHSQHIPTQPG